MKKNRKRTVYNYQKHSFTYGDITVSDNDICFYGLHKENDRVKVDIKRLRKLGLSCFNEGYLIEASQIPRNTIYFLPSKIHKNDYFINQFRSVFIDLSSQWVEIKQAFSKVKTPKDEYSNARVNALLNGVFDIEEADEQGIMYAVKREKPYAKMWKSQCAQFIHQIATSLDALMLKVCMSIGYSRQDVSRGSMHDYLNGTKKGEICVEDLDSYEIYSKFYTIWNLIKHNSLELFNKVKKKYPDMLLVKEYISGELAQNYLDIGDEYIEQMLKGLLPFYEELCSKFFNENKEQSKWNYDDYFLLNVLDYIEEINNPLGC